VAFDGEGARRYGGRWNHIGVPAVYTAAHLSLAVLEVLVHVSAEEDLPADLVAISADLPDDLAIEHVRIEELPVNWRRTPAPPMLAERGTAWLTAVRTAVLAVPSAVIPSETNYILNPAHPDFRRVVVHRAERFNLDPRLAGAVSPARLPARRTGLPRRRRSIRG
jgi:RES domain-containing protein